MSPREFIVFSASQEISLREAYAHAMGLCSGYQRVGSREQGSCHVETLEFEQRTRCECIALLRALFSTRVGNHGDKAVTAYFFLSKERTPQCLHVTSD